MELNNREIATLIWIATAFLAAVLHRTTREGLLDVAKVFFSRQIMTVVGLLLTYVIAQVWILTLAGIWDYGQLKNTIIWSVAVAFVALFRIPNISDNAHFFRDWIKDNLKLIVLLEFFVSFYTFSLMTELIIIPVVTFAVAAVAVGERDPKLKPATDLFQGLLGAFGMFLIGFGIYMVAGDFWGFATIGTARDFAMPIILSLTLLPFIFVIHVYMSYETSFTSLHFLIRDDSLRRYARLRAIFSFGPRITLLRRWVRNLGTDRPTDRADIERSIQEVKTAWRREKNPHEVDSSRGWSPNLARAFLEKEDMVAGDYHRSFEAWYAATPYLELDDALLPNNAVYYIEGSELVAVRLKLVLHINSPANADAAEARFRRIATSLLENALPASLELPWPDDFELIHDNRRFKLETEKWHGGIRGGYERRLIIEMVES